VLECVQRQFADVLAKASHFAHEIRRVASDADAGGGDEEGQDEQKPGSVIDVVQAQFLKHLEPERAELDEVAAVRFGLLQHRADNRRDREDGQQADGKSHRAQ